MMYRRFPTYLAIVFILTAIGFALLGIFSCNTIRKSENKIRKHGGKQPVALARVCLERFPPVDSVRLVYRTLPGRNDTIIDSIPFIVDCGEARDTVIRWRVVKSPVRTVIRVDTVYTDRVVYQSDKAALEVCETEMVAALDEASKWKRKHAGALRIACILGVTLLLVMVLAILRLFFGRRL